MRRAILVGALITVGGLSLAVSGQAPGPSATSIKAMTIERVKGNLYVSWARAPATRPDPR
jgi:hypothetical protein